MKCNKCESQLNFGITPAEDDKFVEASVECVNPKCELYSPIERQFKGVLSAGLWVHSILKQLGHKVV